MTRVGKFESGSEVNTTANSSSNWEYRVNYKSSCEANPMMEGTVTLEFWCGTTLVSAAFCLTSLSVTWCTLSVVSLVFSDAAPLRVACAQC